jgi:hypothetical protein
VAEGGRLLLVSSRQSPIVGVSTIERDVRHDPEGVAAEIRARCDQVPAVAVMSNQEMFVTAAAATADVLGISRNPTAAVIASRDRPG